MTLISRLKRAVTNSFLRRPSVMNHAMAKAFANPRWVTKMTRNPAMRAKLLDGMAQRPNALTDMLDHPDIQAKIVRSPKFFDIMLAKTLRQPEALALALSQRGIRPLLAAQNDFIDSIATNPNYVGKIMKAIPPASLPDAATALFRLHRENVAVPDATVEEFAMSILATANQPSKENREILTDMLVTHLGQSLKPLLLTLARDYPDMLSEAVQLKSVRTAIIASAEADIGPLCDLIRNFIVVSHAAPTPAGRITMLMQNILADPAAKRALSEDADLRALMLSSLDNAFESNGSSLRDHLKTPQHADADSA